MGERNRGQVLIMFVLALFVLLGFVALGVDVGYMYSVKNDLQRSADAGALAGAYVFHDRGLPDSVVEGKARISATDFAKRGYPVGDAPLVTVTFPVINQIQVDVQKNLNLFFAGVLPLVNPTPTLKARATATAEVVQVGQNVECLKPLAVPLPYVDSDMTDDRYDRLDPGATVYNNCSGLGTLCQGENLLQPRHLRIVNNNYIDNSSEVQQNSGRLFALDMCGSGGIGNGTYQDWIEDWCTETCPGGSDFVADIGSRIPVKRDQPFSLTRDSLQSLIDDDDGVATFDTDPDYPDLPRSNDYNKDNWINSPRVIRVALYNPSVVADPALQTDTSIPVYGFAGFWIKGMYSRDRIIMVGLPPIPVTITDWFVDGYLIPNSAVAKPIPLTPPPPPSIEPFLKTTRLVPNAVN